MRAGEAALSPASATGGSAAGALKRGGSFSAARASNHPGKSRRRAAATGAGVRGFGGGFGLQALREIQPPSINRKYGFK